RVAGAVEQRQRQIRGERQPGDARGAPQMAAVELAGVEDAAARGAQVGVFVLPVRVAGEAQRRRLRGAEIEEARLAQVEMRKAAALARLREGSESGGRGGSQRQRAGSPRQLDG